MSNEPTPDGPDRDSESGSENPESPLDQSPLDQSPFDQSPLDQSPSDEAPSDESPTDEAPSDETPADESPSDESPDTTPAEESIDPTTDEPAVDGSTEAGDGSEAATVEADASVSDSGYVPPQQHPYYVAAPPVRRLVRDPYSRLGGVSSGIAHHYGIDVSLVRLGFVLATLFSGVGLILYLLAWLIIPRAEYWPPTPPPGRGQGGSPFEGRELAYGLLVLGVLLAVFAGGGGAARLVVSVGLVAAGVWLLVQPPSTQSGQSAPSTSPGPQPPPTTEGGEAGQGVSQPVTEATQAVPSSWQPAPADATQPLGPDDDATTSQFAGSPTTATAAYGGAAVPPQTVYVPSPVPPRRRRIWPIVLLLAIFILPVLFVGALVSFIIFGGDNFSEANITLTPSTVEEIPLRIDEGAGTITVDLRNLDAVDFEGVTVPRGLDIDMNAGEITVELPDDLAVTVDASAGAGDVTVFDDSEDGIRPRITTVDDDAVLELDIRLGVGEITVER